MSNNFFTICSFFYIILLNITYFSKPRIKTLETKMYQYMALCNLLTITTAVLSFFTITNVSTFPLLNEIISKILLLTFFFWGTLFVIYVFSITYEKKAEKIIKNKKFKFLLALFCTIACFIIICLPLYYHNDNNVIYSYGPAANVTFLFSGIDVIFYFVFLYIGVKKGLNKKYIPLIIYVVFGGVVVVIQKIHPELLLVSAMETFVTFLMYFTIENPDVKMIEQLNIAKDQADKANNAKTEFLSSMSHEIRTPLNAIDGFSQLILEENDIKVIKDEARDIMAASQNLLEIVNGILDISKIEADKLEIVNVEYEPTKIFDELAKLTKARIGEKPLEFRVNIAKDLPDYLNGDYVRVKQIVLNLLTNAVKYTKEGFVEFNVQTVKKDGVCRLIISVKDSGIGIKKDNIDKLFTKFERFDKEKNLTIEGTGLGLAITKKLVELMHGKIVVDSVYGKGSTFTVSLDQKIVDKKKVKVADAEVKTTNKLNVKGKKVLIVDDNLINLKVAARLLEGYKLVTECVSSGFDCIKKIEECNKYDLILMDDMMPKMSGVETFKKLKAMDNFNIPTIALTANAIAGMKEQYLKDGFNDYISKPIDKKELERVLKTYLK